MTPNDDTVNPQDNQQDEVATSSFREEVLSKHLLPILPLILLFVMFLALFGTAKLIGLPLPEGLQFFMFIILLFLSLGVFLTKVLQDTFQFKVKGYLIQGALAVLFILSYFAVDKWPDLACALKIPGYCVTEGQSNISTISLAEVRLNCSLPENLTENEKKKYSSIKSRNLYMLIEGGSNYISFIKDELKKLEKSGNYPFEMLKENSPERNFLATQAGTRGDWVSYAIPQYMARNLYVPIPTKVDNDHTTSFYFDSVKESALNTDLINASGEDQTMTMIKIAQIGIEPNFSKDAPKEPDLAGVAGNSKADNKSGKIKIILNLHAGRMRCWSPEPPQ